MAVKSPKTARGNPGVPKPKGRRRREQEGGIKDMGPRKQTGPLTVDLLIREDASGLFAMDGNIRIGMSPYNRNPVSAGEVWSCMTDDDGIMGRQFIAIALVGRRDAGDSDASAPEIPGQADVPAPCEDAGEAGPAEGCDDGEIAALRRTVADLRAKLSAMERLEADLEARDAEVRKLKRTVDSLTVQVNRLNQKDSVKNRMAMESTIGSLNEAIESKDLEISRLREKLKSMGVDDMAVVKPMPRVPKAVLMGEESVHCTVLDDGRYTVYVSPLLRTLRIVPDECGRVWCRDGTIRLRCIRGFSGFEKARPLEIEEGDGCTIIRL